MNDPSHLPAPTLLDRIRRAARQEQFLQVLSRDEAERRFHAALSLGPLPAEEVGVFDALGRVVATTVHARIDSPPFDRALVDGFALRAADTGGATDAAACRLVLNAEVLTCGTVPAVTVAAGTATAIATGAVMPRGADAVVMIEHTEFDEQAADAPAVLIHRAAAPGQFVGFAGSRHRPRRDAAARRHGDRLARDRHAGGGRARRACRSCGGPRVAVLSTGDELVPAGTADAAARRHPRQQRRDHRRRGHRERRRADAARHHSATTRRRWSGRCTRRSGSADIVVLSGGTSKGAGDVSHRILARLGRARHRRARRGAEAGQAAVPRGRAPASRSWCCRGFRPRRCSPSTNSSCR